MGLLLFNLGCPGRQSSELDKPPTNDSGPVAERAMSTPASPQVAPESGDPESIAAEPTHGQQAPEAPTIGLGIAPTEPESDALTPRRLLEQGQWTSLRIVTLAANGPIVIDLQAQVGLLDLSSALRLSVQPICEKLLLDLEQDATWEAALSHPLIRSGWLGMFATPTTEPTQIPQTLDFDGDGKIQIDELTGLLGSGDETLGMLRFADDSRTSAGNFASPWGPIDLDQNHCLDSSEIQSAAELMFDLDLDGDSNISRAEILPEPTQGSAMISRGSQPMLAVLSVMVESEEDRSTEATKRQRALKRKATDLLQHYTFLGVINREEWSGCSDRLWKQLDASGDQQLDVQEVAKIFDVEPDYRLGLKLPAIESSLSPKAQAASGSMTVSPNAEPAQDLAQWFLVPKAPDEQYDWRSLGESCCFQADGLHLLARVEDAFGLGLQRLIRAQLDSALRNPQLEAAITSQLQLSAGAFDLLDSDGDDSLSDEEFSQVWNWLVSRQLSRLQANWSVASESWFQLLDQDLNARLGDWELSQLSQIAQRLDVDQDGQVDQQEMPLTITLRVIRADNRLSVPQSLLTNLALEGSPVSDWFSAMDTNGDAAISPGEFLGSPSQFRDMDRDGNGFISRSEMP